MIEDQTVKAGFAGAGHFLERAMAHVLKLDCPKCQKKNEFVFDGQRTCTDSCYFCNLSFTCELVASPGSSQPVVEVRTEHNADALRYEITPNFALSLLKERVAHAADNKASGTEAARPDPLADDTATPASGLGTETQHRKQELEREILRSLEKLAGEIERFSTQFHDTFEKLNARVTEPIDGLLSSPAFTENLQKLAFLGNGDVADSMSELQKNIKILRGQAEAAIPYSTEQLLKLKENYTNSVRGLAKLTTLTSKFQELFPDYELFLSKFGEFVQQSATKSGTAGAAPAEVSDVGASAAERVEPAAKVEATVQPAIGETPIPLEAAPESSGEEPVLATEVPADASAGGDASPADESSRAEPAGKTAGENPLSFLKKLQSNDQQIGPRNVSRAHAGRTAPVVDITRGIDEATFTVRLNQAVQRSLSQTALREILDVYNQALDSNHDARGGAIKRLPDLFDAIDLEIKGWRENEDLPPEIRGCVLDVLDRIQQQIESWQDRSGITRIPQEGEEFDRARHEKFGTRFTTDANQENRVCSIVRMGYGLRSSQAPDEYAILRRARVEVWVKPLSGND